MTAAMFRPFRAGLAFDERNELTARFQNRFRTITAPWGLELIHPALNPVSL
jgi:hypothetical protein